MAKEGPKSKDAPITDNFNPDKTIKLNREELARAKRQAVANRRQSKIDDAERTRLRREKKALDKKLLEDKLRELAKIGLAVTEEEKELERQELEREAAEVEEEEISEKSEKPNDRPKKDKDEQSAYQMLQDMRYVYRKVKGRRKLAELIDSDDKQFVFMVKELMKIEAQLMSAKIRAKEDLSGGQQTVFVVLKGLEEGPQVIEVQDSGIDQRQITAALTPDGGEYVPE